MASTDKKCTANSDCATNQTCSNNTCVDLKVSFWNNRTKLNIIIFVTSILFLTLLFILLLKH